MVASLAVLAERSLSGKVLGGCLVPMNNNISYVESASIVSVTIVDNDEITHVAYGAINQYSNKQAYCVLGEVADKYKGHTIWVDEIKTENKKSKIFKVTNSVPYEVNTLGATGFETVFADHQGRLAHLHLVDALIEASLGIKNMDIAKNFSVDIIHDNRSTLSSVRRDWRDIAGFVVSDKYTFEQITVNRFELLSLEKEGSQIELEQISKDTVMSVLDYDVEVSVYDRTEHVTALLNTVGIIGKLATKDGQPCGYALALNDRILQCYGEDEDTIRQLLAGVASEMMHPQISLFARLDSNKTMDTLVELATERVQVTRLHSRALVGGLKWAQIACPNMGLHIF